MAAQSNQEVFSEVFSKLEILTKQNQENVQALGIEIPKIKNSPKVEQELEAVYAMLIHTGKLLEQLTQTIKEKTK